MILGFSLNHQIVRDLNEAWISALNNITSIDVYYILWILQSDNDLLKPDICDRPFSVTVIRYVLSSTDRRTHTGF